LRSRPIRNDEEVADDTNSFAIDMTAAVHFGGLPLLLVLYAHKSRLRMNVTWTEPLMDDGTAQAWIDRIWNTLAGMFA
jgi:hypothetical protein